MSIEFCDVKGKVSENLLSCRSEEVFPCPDELFAYLVLICVFTVCLGTQAREFKQENATLLFSMSC